MGAWIETEELCLYLTLYASLSAWERGLKLLGVRICDDVNTSLSAWERGLKHKYDQNRKS